MAVVPACCRKAMVYRGATRQWWYARSFVVVSSNFSRPNESNLWKKFEAFRLEWHTILNNIHSPQDIKSFSAVELRSLAREMREIIIETVAKGGGHLSSNLGVVELTIALHRAFDSPTDAIIFDVGHQCYAHKLITGRYDRFSTLRQKGGISGFTRTGESCHDAFDSGHASVSISQALGLLVGRELTGKAGKVVAVIGDGALTGGIAFEGLSNAGLLSRDLIVVLNDNQMSIDHNTGALSRYLSRMTATSGYQTIRHKIDRTIDRLPYLGRHLEKMVFRMKRAMKGLLYTNNLFVDLGFEYVGPLDGHDEAAMEDVFRRVRNMRGPVVVHVVTKKGRGYRPAEDRPEEFHGVGPFCISDGKVEKFDKMSFTEVFSDIIDEMAKEHTDIAAVTAAMAKGTGLSAFSRHYPTRFFDVGIAEEHAVTFGGGLAKGGMMPFVCIYSTFAQRAVDCVIHDVALQKAHIVLVLDRAGVVGGDGETHQGLFDIALFRPVPGIAIMSPASAGDLKICIEWAYNASMPVIIRYPKSTTPTEREPFSQAVTLGRGILVKASVFATALDAQAEDPSDEGGIRDVLFVCTGGMYGECVMAARELLMKGAICDIYTLRFIKPLDENAFIETAGMYKAVLVVEDGVEAGGIAEHLASVMARRLALVKCKAMAVADKFIAQGTRDQILEDTKLSASDLAREAYSLLRM